LREYATTGPSTALRSGGMTILLQGQEFLA